MLQIHCVCLLLILLTAGLAKDQRKAIGSSIADQNQIASQRINPIDGAETVFIPPGAFMMGSDAAELDQIWRKFNWPDGFGLYDMAGKVLQWCEDWYDKNYYRNSPTTNPHGPSRGELRVLRGGAFDTIPAITRISRRPGARPDIHHDEKGFRCVQER
jgi:formylglycine-generating enzyme required for sulfatase activity